MCRNPRFGDTAWHLSLSAMAIHTAPCPNTVDTALEIRCSLRVEDGNAPHSGQCPRLQPGLTLNGAGAGPE